MISEPGRRRGRLS